MGAVQEVDFLIVGAGPIGSALALSLSKISKNLSIVLVDQNPRQSFDSSFGDSFDSVFDTKVFAVNNGSRQLFESLGIWAEIEKNRHCPYERMHVWDSEGTGSVSFSLDDLSEGLEVSNIKELGFIIEASIIQNALNKGISSTSNIQVCRPASIERTKWQDEQDQSHGQQRAVSVIAQLDTGESFSAGMVCAADGARSGLRQIAGIRTVDENCEQKALVANIQLSKPHESCAWQIFRPTGPLAFLPLQSESQRDCSIVWSLDTAEAERIEKLDDARFLNELERAVEGRFGALKLNSKRLSFPLWQRHALDYGIPGMVLVGDSAHSIHPLAGLGANLGFQDVASLSKELGRAFDRGIYFGHKSVISRYQRQRRVDNELTLKAMKVFKTSFADHGMVLNAMRNMGLKFFSDSKPLKAMVARHALMSGD